MTLDAAIRQAVRTWAAQGRLRAVNTARDRYLSGQSLKRRTGTAVRSVTSRSKVLGTGDGFEFGTNLGYLIAWENGIPGHWVRPKTKKALRFKVGGKTVFSKKAFISPQLPRPWARPAWNDIQPYLRETGEQLLLNAMQAALPNRTIEIG